MIRITEKAGVIYIHQLQLLFISHDFFHSIRRWRKPITWKQEYITLVYIQFSLSGPRYWVIQLTHPYDSLCLVKRSNLTPIGVWVDQLQVYGYMGPVSGPRMIPALLAPWTAALSNLTLYRLISVLDLRSRVSYYCLRSIIGFEPPLPHYLNLHQFIGTGHSPLPRSALRASVSRVYLNICT